MTVRIIFLLPRFGGNVANVISVPDLLITVNFTALGIDAASLSDYRLKVRTVSIVVGFHNDTMDIVRNALAIPLAPDAHLLAGVLRNVRYEYKNPILASLGGPSSVRPSVHLFLIHIHIMTHQRAKYVTAFVPFLTPDTSSQTPRDNNTATLRLYTQTDLSNVRVSVDYREKSILTGLSALGGFWTIANGVFASIFGTTLWWVLFGE